jgi:hypothetical protein
LGNARRSANLIGIRTFTRQDVYTGWQANAVWR